MEGLSPTGGGRDRRLSNGVVIGSRGFVERMGEALCNQCENAKGLDEATRMQIEALNGSTIHSLLGGFPPNWKYTADNRLPLKLVVVDESSMVDILLMLEVYNLISYILLQERR